MEMQVLEFLLGAIDNIIIFVFANSLLSRRSKRAYSLFVAILACSVSVFVTDKLNFLLKSLISITMLIIVFSILFKEKIYIKSALATISLYLLYIIDIIVGNTISLIFDEQILYVFYSGFISRLLICLVIKAINIVAFVGFYKMFLKMEFEMPKKNWLLYNAIVFVFMTMSILFMYVYSAAEYDKFFAILFLAISVIFFAMSIIVMYFFTELCAGFQKEKRMYILESSSVSMQNALAAQNHTNTRLRKLRHDIRNHLDTAIALLDNGEQDDAGRLLKGVFGQVENIGKELDQSTGNSLIDSVVAYKKAVCESKEIKFCYSLENLPKIKIDLSDLSSLLSNLLDNAIEATERAKRPFIEIKVFEYKSFLAISITNTYNGTIFAENGVLHMVKHNKSVHGFGTQIIHEICDKYNGSYRYDYDEELFTANVLLEY